MTVGTGRVGVTERLQLMDVGALKRRLLGDPLRNEQITFAPSVPGPQRPGKWLSRARGSGQPAVLQIDYRITNIRFAADSPPTVTRYT